ncbi:polysaccharide pyruvyl transferase family protein [Olivibacter sitiensis]|uniref:polysaccharide pyruvyl transferase family protein n=1 Tax=Olivibacter sitiensis TaxID=376470 RepID=UPI000485FC9F|nr:polysaccharide pyruvyl transferase family protein [Olivibacter sitiensis]
MTFWESKNNYGQILQLFALQQYLKKLGHDPFLIRFKRVPPNDTRTLIQKIRDEGLLRLILQKLEAPKRKKSIELDKLRHFRAFKAENIVFGKKDYRNLAELRADPPKADVYIVGSDQVWNNKFSVSAEPFLLGFGDDRIKRISYAASFGQSVIDEETQLLFKKYLPAFKAISVREKSGVDICNHMGVAAEWLPDPTLLFEAREWEDMLCLNMPNNINQKSIFAYTLGNSKIKDLDKFVGFLRRKSGYKLIRAGANSDFSGDCYPTIPEWVAHIKQADFVLTTSFHGMVFCIIYNTNFVILPNTGKALGMNERIVSLLAKLGLQDHIMDKYSHEKLNGLFTKKVNWGYVNEQLSNWRIEANEFLMRL